MKRSDNLILNAPVLFLVFNRLDTTKKVFEEIRKARPKKLFIAADGPRTKEEKKKTDEVRNYVLKNIDWDCKVKKFFRKKNLGCKYAVSGAIDWFFENVEQGIILEDDTLPSQSFFRFCQELLEKYKKEEKVMHISGTNVEGVSDIEESYLFSKTFNVWGWATWKRAWKCYDVEMRDWIRYRSFSGLKDLGYRGLFWSLNARRILNLTYKGKIDTWDYQWDFACRKKGGLSIIPQKNLITNIGFEEGTHTTNYKKENKSLKRFEISFPLEHNLHVKPSQFYYERFMSFFQGNLIKKLIKKIS
ncbi:MAG: glycosyltransferase family 2 protein [Candidatus Paceibacteria bacterium]